MKELLTLVAVALTCMALRGAPPELGAEKPTWLTNYEAARKVSRAAAKPIFVVFRCEH